MPFKHKHGAAQLGRKKSYLTSDLLNNDDNYIVGDICKMAEFLVADTYPCWTGPSLKFDLLCRARLMFDEAKLSRKLLLKVETVQLTIEALKMGSKLNSLHTKQL